ncbi:MAG TPA: FxDxF family PEP-CTERM protein [Aquabacterium sp.]|nr:FxDxF family PEP-CTERM protein [Aquabacterium sp.]HQC97215.1 FxDxF family PEP-CTERM protein [Aquabacterium sp.]
MNKLLIASLSVLAGAAQAHLTVFEGVFLPETAVVSGQTRTGTGTGTLRLEYDEDGHTLLVQASWSGLTGNANNAHIHCCTAAPATGTAGIALAQQPANLLPGFPLGGTFGTYEAVIDLTVASNYGTAFRLASGPGGANGTPADAEARLISNLASQKAYLNIHTSYIGGGELRAFVTAVPEPQTYALMLAGLGVLGWAARRRQVG